MIEGIDSVSVTDTALRRTATQFKDHCEVRGWVDKVPRAPNMAAFLCVTLRLGNDISIILQAYGEGVNECEGKVQELRASLGSSPHATPERKRITDITNALREQE